MAATGVPLSDRRLAAEAEADVITSQRRSEACQSALVFLVKLAALVVAVVLSGVGGSFLFMALEQTNELQLCTLNEALYEQAETDLAVK